MTDADLRRRCQAWLATAPLDGARDVTDLAEAIGQSRGRPLHMVPKQDPGGPCGLWLATDDADYCFYDKDTSRLHQNHIILHELGHLIAGHVHSEAVTDTTLRVLLPHLDPSLVRRALARSRYSTVEEQEAETLATLLETRLNFAADGPVANGPRDSMDVLRGALRSARG